MNYELFYLVGASRESELENIRKEVNEIVLSVKGIFEEKETLEKRKLAYKIKHETHGIYIAQRFELADPEQIKDVINKLNLHPNVLRFVISRTDELPSLKSKEERINEANNANRVAEKNDKEKLAATATLPKEIAQKAEPKEEATIAPEKKEDKTEEKLESLPESQDDIDKKLEEILNI